MGDFTLLGLLETGARLRSSDLHLSCGMPPMFRVDGSLRRAECGIVSASWLEEQLSLIVSRDELSSWRPPNVIERAVRIDSFPDFRLRLSAFWSCGAPAAAIRFIPLRIPTPEECGIPDCLVRLSRSRSGLILITGSAGSGKSTTLASLANAIDKAVPRHIISLEDPPEYSYPVGRGLVHQMQVFKDCGDYPSAIRAALRMDPDVIMIGEIRDAATVDAALTAAETGHLVMATMHTRSAPQTVDRVTGACDDPHTGVRLAQALLAVCSQRLVPAIGGGRCLAAEVMVGTPAVCSCIREGRVSQLKNIIQTGSGDGMCTLEQSLARLVRSGRVGESVAADFSNDAHALKRILES